MTPNKESTNLHPRKAAIRRGKARSRRVKETPELQGGGVIARYSNYKTQTLEGLDVFYLLANCKMVGSWLVATQIFFKCSSRKLGKWSNLTNIFLVGLKPPTRFGFLLGRLIHTISFDFFSLIWFWIWPELALQDCRQTIGMRSPQQQFVEQATMNGWID